MELSSFWSGAMVHGAQVDVRAVAEACGVLRCTDTADARALIAAGVPSMTAQLWAGTPPQRTLGEPVVLTDPRYPAAVRRLPDPPPVFFVEGSVERLSQPGLAIVGTRGCTAYGAAVARELAVEAAAAGLVVVSGLARGIDGHAHAAVARTGATVAVLGHGLASTAPARHRGLRADILAGGGAMVSTFPDDLPARRHTFPMRNRWIAALSRLVVVVEAPLRSGARITAREALDLGIDVAVVPGRLGDSASAGCLALIAQGARPVTSVRGLVVEVSGTVPKIDAAEDWMRPLVSGQPLAQIARQRGISLAQLLAEVSKAERMGRLVRLPGQRYALSSKEASARCGGGAG